MSTLVHFCPGDRAIGFLLVLTLGVALVSSVTWLISQRLAGKAALKHLVLLSALVCILALPVVSWLCFATELTLVSIPILGEDSRPTVSEVMLVHPEAIETEPQQWTEPNPGAAEPSSSQVSARIDLSAKESTSATANQNAAPSVSPAPDAPRAAGLTNLPLSFRGILSILLLFWAAGALLMLTRVAWNCGRVARLRRSSRPLENESLQALLHQVAGELKTRQVPRLLVSRRIISPLAVGFGRPAVILPERLLGSVSDSELIDVLVHELTHLQRRDQWTVLLQALAGALYWPIVSVHALNRELRRASEEICDNAVLARRDAVSYGETLLHVAELLVHACPMTAAVGILGGRGELERRIAGLIDPRREIMTTTGRKGACIVMFLFLAASVLLSATRFSASAGAAGAMSKTVTGDVASDSESSPPSAGESTKPTSPAQQPVAGIDADDPKSASRFSGQVTGPTGKPIRGARVYVQPLSDGLDGTRSMRTDKGPLAVRALSGADGRFQFDAPDLTLTDQDGLPTRRWCDVIAMSDGDGVAWISTRGRTRATEIRKPLKGTDLDLQLAADDTPIHGQLLDPDGRPLAGASVRLMRLMMPQQRDLNTYIKYVTNENSAVMNGPEFERSLYQPAPLPGLTVETRTDAEGRFTLSGLGRERLAELKVTGPGVVDTTLTVMTREAPNVGTNRIDGKPTEFTYGARFSLQLKRGVTLSGLVRDRETQKPIAGMWVGISSDPMNGLWTGEYSRKTDADGRFTISGLTPGVKREVVAVSSPGLPYLTSSAEAIEASQVLIEAPRGVPYHLKLLDEQGQPIAGAEVSYREVQPNKQLPRMPYAYDGRWPISRAADRGAGIYEGFALPGPGAVLVKTPRRLGYRAAHVDPKAYFAPGRKDWTAQERISAFGNHDTLSSSNSWIDQHDYTAIVLVNPPQDSKPLELSATMVKDRPRQVSLVDADGQPVVGVSTQGMTYHPYDSESTLRSATFPLTGLHPDRIQRITFINKDRRLIGFLMARGESDTPYTVRMQPWGTITGRLLDENGVPLQATSIIELDPSSKGLETNPDPEVGQDGRVEWISDGQFRIDRLVPGQRYSAKVYYGIGKFAGMAFENLVLQPGESLDLGNIRTKQVVDAKDEEKLQGTWAIVKDVENGREEKGVLGGMEFAGDKLVMMSLLGSVEYKWTLDATKKPAWIDLKYIKETAGFFKSEEQSWKGVYQIQGNTMTVLLGPADKERPTHLAAKPGEEEFLVVLRRLAPAEE